MAGFRRKVAHLARYKLNQVGHPFGLNVFPMVWPPDVRGERSSVFDAIFRSNFWGSTESRSGPGSARAYTNAYRPRLVALLRDRGWKTLFDAPCGDLFWMSQLLHEYSISYRGGDISASLVRTVNRTYPDLDVRVFDICRDSFPPADVWHCRDCFFHLPFADIWAALERFVESDVPWALLTSHRARIHRNLDVAAGGYRLLDLRRPPFSFPPAVEELDDYRPGRSFPRYVGLWSKSTILEALRRVPATKSPAPE